MKQVTLMNGGTKWYLRRTTWTSDEARGDTFATREAAEQAIEKAKKFLASARLKKAISIEDVI